jgi:glutathione S-transferase
MRRRFEISAESAANSREKMVAAIDRLERDICASGYLVGESFTVADLTAAALLYPVARPAEFAYPMVAHDDLPASWREFLDSLAQRPGGQWVAEIYRRHRGRSAALTSAGATQTPPSDALPRETAETLVATDRAASAASSTHYASTR